jgi:hypothetical protein
VTPETVITCPAAESVPVEAVVYPACPEVVEGAVQPEGEATVTAPLESPLEGAV